MKKYFILAAAAAMFAACSNNDDLAQGETPTERIPLTIGAATGDLTVNSTMRGNTIDVQDKNNLLSSNQVGMFILKEGQTAFAATSDFEQKNLSSTSIDDDNPLANYTNITPSSTIYYPGDKTQGIDIYVYAPYVSSTTSSSTASYIPASWADIASDKITFYTQNDQTEEAKYMASDVLWGCAGNGAAITTAYTASSGNPYYDANYAAPTGLTSNSTISANTYATALTKTEGFTNAFYRKSTKAADVVVPMLHRGSKIIVNLKTDGMLYTALKNAEVKINVDYLQGQLNLSTGELEKTGTAAVNPVLLTTHLGIDAPGATPTEEGVYQESSTTVGYSCSGVIVPQTLTEVVTNQNKAFIEIGLKESTSTAATNAASTPGTLTATYAWKPASAPTFESGKKYIYTITVKSDGLVVDVSVVDWVDAFGGTPTTGDATLQ